MAGTFLQSFMICLQRLDQSGSPVGADKEEKNNVSPCLTSPLRPSVGDHPPSRVGTTPSPGAGTETPHHHCSERFSPAAEACARPDGISPPNRD